MASDNKTINTANVFNLSNGQLTALPTASGNVAVNTLIANSTAPRSPRVESIDLLGDVLGAVGAGAEKGTSGTGNSNLTDLSKTLGVVGKINDALLDAFSKADQAAADLKAQYPGVQVADAGGGLPQTSTHASTNTNSFSNFLNTQGSSLPPAQQETLAAQVNSLGLGGEADLSFYSLPGGGALIANADGDIVGEINHSDAGDLNLRATAIDAEGNAVQVSQHISESGQSLTDAQYSQQQLGQLSAGLGLVNNFQALQNWGDLNDLSRLSTLVGTYNNLSNLSGGASGFLGDLGPLAGGLGLLAALDSGDGLGIVSSINVLTDSAVDGAINSALGSSAIPYLSIVTSLANFEDNPLQSMGSLVGMAIGGPIGAAIGGLTRGEAVNGEFFRSVA